MSSRTSLSISWITVPQSGIQEHCFINKSKDRFDIERIKQVISYLVESQGLFVLYYTYGEPKRADDSDIYYLHIMGLTDCCQNLLLESANAQTYAFGILHP